MLSEIDEVMEGWITYIPKEKTSTNCGSVVDE
jgi:hypothetical protein